MQHDISRYKTIHRFAVVYFFQTFQKREDLTSTSLASRGRKDIAFFLLLLKCLHIFAGIFFRCACLSACVTMFCQSELGIFARVCLCEREREERGCIGKRVSRTVRIKEKERGKNYYGSF